MGKDDFDGIVVGLTEAYSGTPSPQVFFVVGRSKVNVFLFTAPPARCSGDGI